MPICAQTWQVRCSVCGRAKWPYAAHRPDPYTCALCRMRPAGAREAKQAAGRSGMARKRVLEAQRSTEGPRSNAPAARKRDEGA